MKENKKQKLKGYAIFNSYGYMLIHTKEQFKYTAIIKFTKSRIISDWKAYKRAGYTCKKVIVKQL